MREEILKARIQKFKQEYLESPEGRAHYQTEFREQGDIQTTYKELLEKRATGQDITSTVLEHLLPYNNTQGNRQRGVHISTWPCITKDIRSWFENAGWKNATEWPEVAIWIMDIAQAGQTENWENWGELAKKPIQKGFQDGFITPIVHCLNPKLPVINNKVVETFQNVTTELGLKVEITNALKDYPTNQMRLRELVERLRPLGLNDLLEWDIFCHWNVAKRLGKNAVIEPATSLVVAISPPILPKTPNEKSYDNVQVLVEELRAAQYDTKDPARFEKAIAKAFQFLGFEAEQFGGPGKADVIAVAALGEDSFSVVIDGKTGQPGEPRTNLNYPPIKAHQEENAADYALVVAESYRSGDTITHATTQKVGLLETGLLILLVEETAKSGLSQYWLKQVFSQVGLISCAQLEKNLNTHRDLVRAMPMVLGIFENFQRRDETSPVLEAHAIQLALKVNKIKLPSEYIEYTLALLSNPLVGILEKQVQGYILTMPAHLAHLRLAELTSALAKAPYD